MPPFDPNNEPLTPAPPSGYGPGIGLGTGTGAAMRSSDMLAKQASTRLAPGAAQLVTLTQSIEMLGMDTKELQEIVGVLAARLAPLTRPGGAEKTESDRLPSASPVADYLVGLHVNLRYTIRQLADLLERLDL